MYHNGISRTRPLVNLEPRLRTEMLLILHVSSGKRSKKQTHVELCGMRRVVHLGPTIVPVPTVVLHRIPGCTHRREKPEVQMVCDELFQTLRADEIVHVLPRIVFRCF